MRIAIAIASLVVAVGCKGGSKQEAPEQSGEPATETPAATATETITPADDAAVAFLIERCIETGLPADPCKCAGDKAKTGLGAKLVAKMSKAPPDDDPALEGYYNGADVQRVMAWVDDASSACGIEEIGQEVE